MYVTMDFEKESPNYYSSSPSSSPSQLSPCNQNSPSDSSHANKAKAAIMSNTHKKKTGRKKFNETRHPIYRGVRQRNGKKWVCEVREPNKKSRIWLGTYPTPEMAARAHDVAVLALKGISAVFNFPDSVSLLPVLKSTNSAADIREAASKAAKSFKPTTTTTPSVNNSRVEITNPCLMECKSQLEGVLEGDDVIIVKSVFWQEEIKNNDESKSMFFDEEVLYNMPGFLDSMAEGLLITPPSMKLRALDWDDVDCETDLRLWTD